MKEVKLFGGEGEREPVKPMENGEWKMINALSEGKLFIIHFPLSIYLDKFQFPEPTEYI
jgi:hypothetical protein